MAGLARIASVGILATALTACESPVSPSELLALDRAEARWAARGFRNYAIEMREACFCPAAVSQWVRVEVVADTINRVVFVDSAVEVPSSERSYFVTVEQVFAEIQTVNQHPDWVQDVTVKFDAQLGFPTEVDYVPQDGILDAGSVRYLRHAVPLP